MKSPYGLSAECVDCHSGSADFFCALSQESVEALSQIKHAATFPEDSVIFMEGQTPRGVFMLCQGQVKLSTTSRNGKTLILRIAKPGEVLGLDAVVTGRPYQLIAETMQPCLLNFVNRDDFLRFLKEHGDACLRAANQTGGYCHDAYDVVRSIGLSHSASRKIAKFLLASAVGGRVRNGVVRASLTLTHEDIAQIIGTSRETITRTIAEFKKKHIAELKLSILTIYDRAALERVVLESANGRKSPLTKALSQADVLSHQAVPTTGQAGRKTPGSI
jgi:CRP/FNR family cyclic AMP-dependent transcriptional regulator